MPGYQMAISPPIRTRIDMLTTGVRTPVGIKVFGAGPRPRSSASRSQLEGLLRDVPGTRSTFAERQTGREYIDVVPDREAIARYGLTVRDVHDVVEAAIGGMTVSTVIAGRARFSINLRYAADYRADPEALRSILVPVPVRSRSPLSMAAAGAGTPAPMGAMQGGASPAAGSGGGDGGHGSGGHARQSRHQMAGQAMAASDGRGLGIAADPRSLAPAGRRRSRSASRRRRVVTGPPMIKDENGVLVGYVFADIDASQRDLGGWVDDAKALVASDRPAARLPPGSGPASTSSWPRWRRACGSSCR